MVAVIEIPKNAWERETSQLNGISLQTAKPQAGNLAGADANTQRNQLAEAEAAYHQALALPKGPWDAANDEIAALAGLEDNWDGLGAKAPSRDIVESAGGLARLLRQRGSAPPSRIVASTAGSVIFEWQDPDGLYCELEIDAPFHADVMVVEPGQPPRHWELPNA